MYENLRPPTDSLYKFLAVFGLVLIALGVYVGEVHDQKSQEYYSFLIQTEFDKTEREDLVAKYVAIDKRNRDPMAYLSEEELPLDSSEINDAMKIIFQNYYNLRVRLPDLEDELDKLRISKKSLYFIGGAFSIAGFALWYCLVQRYQDELLRMQVMNARSESSKAIAPALSENETPSSSEKSE